jgi:hypothetical protein
VTRHGALLERISTARLQGDIRGGQEARRHHLTSTDALPSLRAE